MWKWRWCQMNGLQCRTPSLLLSHLWHNEVGTVACRADRTKTRSTHAAELLTATECTTSRRTVCQSSTGAQKPSICSSWDGRPFRHNSYGSKRHRPKSGGCCASLRGGELGSHLTQCRLSRGLPPYQVASWSIQPFGHNTPTLQTDTHDRQNIVTVA